MARRPRRELGDGIFHVSSRGNRRQAIATCDRDAARFFELLGEATRRYGVACLAYCLMPNHYHLILRAERPRLSYAMHRLNASYAQWFNRMYRLDGHLFQGRFHAVRVDGDSHLAELGRYLALNPVRAGLAARADEWSWSSYSAAIGVAPRPSFLAADELLLQFASAVHEAQMRFAALVRDGMTA